MRKCLNVLAVLVLLYSSPAPAADAPAKPATKPTGAAAERGSVAETVKLDWTFTPDPALPNVLILGDSISIGYGLPLRKELAGKANVYRPLRGKNAENCNGTTYGLKRLDAWLTEPGVKWSVIHFNFGLHDLKHVKHPGDDKISEDLTDPQQADVDTYAKNLEQIVQRLEKTGAKLIFATTTPCPDVSTGRTQDMPPKYNEAALKIMAAHHVQVDDLYNFVLPHESEYQLPKNVHFNATGNKALAAQVAKTIEPNLPK